MSDEQIQKHVGQIVLYEIRYRHAPDKVQRESAERKLKAEVAALHEALKE